MPPPRPSSHRVNLAYRHCRHAAGSGKSWDAPLMPSSNSSIMSGIQRSASASGPSSGFVKWSTARIVGDTGDQATETADHCSDPFHQHLDKVHDPTFETDSIVRTPSVTVFHRPYQMPPWIPPPVSNAATQIRKPAATDEIAPDPCRSVLLVGHIEARNLPQAAPDSKASELWHHFLRRL